MDYRDPLGQAHERIARLEEELSEERAKNAPPPPMPPPPMPPPLPAPLGPDGARAAPRAKVSVLRFWSLPLAMAGAILLVKHHLPFESLIDPSDVETDWLILRALVASFLLFGLEAAVRTRAGQATVVSRLLLVSAGVLAFPLGLVAVTAGVTILGISISVGLAIFGLVKLARWVTRGSTT